MKYYSTNRNSPLVNFREATIQGQAPDKGLYFPQTIPAFTRSLIDKIRNHSNEEIALQVIKPYTGNTIPEEKLMRIVTESIDFPFPLVRIDDRIFSLELFHGPTLAFKDVGARFMSRCLGYFVAQGDVKSPSITVLVATSGDTGGAVASGFYGVDGVEVVILYPSGKVSAVQEMQLTALGKNINAIEVMGNFDDCQRMVKQAFSDPDISARKFLTSANSINIARWLPQQFYYLFAYKQWEKQTPPVISVPSGNFGNICAGILAMKSGLPVKNFIAACNENDILTQYLATQDYVPRKALHTYSNAMDVGDPSNFVRVLEIFEKGFPELRSHLSSACINDDETLDTIRDVAFKYNYIMDPHGAVGYLALYRWLEQHPGESGLFLETAHPVKFPVAVEKATRKKPGLPASLDSLLKKQKQATLMNPDFNHLKEYLLHN